MMDLGDSPEFIPELIKDLIKDKVVCDIGCRNGDLLSKFSRYAKKVIGIEEHKDEYQEAKKLGFEVINRDALEIDLPEADVYYLWVSNPKPMIEKIKKGIIIVSLNTTTCYPDNCEIIGYQCESNRSPDKVWNIAIIRK